MTIASELYGFERFSDPRHLMAFLGLTHSERSSKGANRRFVVTNHFEDAQTLYDECYVQRGEDCENRIKEFKRALKGDRLSCHAFHANQFRLLLTQAAY